MINMVEKNVFIEDARPVRFTDEKTGNTKDVISIRLRTAMDNEKGGGSFPVTTVGKDGKNYHALMLNTAEAKSGPNAGTSQATRFAEAAGFKTAMKDAIKNFDKVLESDSKQFEGLKDKGLKMDMFNGPKDLDAEGKRKPNAILYTDANHQLVNGQIKTENGYEPNPEARNAVPNVNAIKPWRGFDPVKNAEQMKEAKEAKKMAKEAGKTQAQTVTKTPEAPDAGPEV